MVSQKLLFTFFLCCITLLIIGSDVVQSSSHNHHHHHLNRRRIAKKLFVFGDSYADTGNSRKSDGSWNEPYGATFPGKPSGRFSNGRVFTDFLARSLGLKSPIAYRWRKYVTRQIKYGMNFAYGGTGVFDTMAPYPNMTTQIDFFERLLKESVFGHPRDLRNSVAHVSLAGNDYAAYLLKGGSLMGLELYIPKVVTQLVMDLQRIYNLGVKKISITALQPLGCLPANTFENSFQMCNSTSNKAVEFHNLLLQEAVSKLNNKLHNAFAIIDFYTVFSTIIHDKGAEQGTLRFDNPLKPCCVGINKTSKCGSVDGNGNKMYTICENPDSYFFWDFVHPTQAGWNAVTGALQSKLQQLRN